jgi:hypothetical protein
MYKKRQPNQHYAKQHTKRHKYFAQFSHDAVPLSFRLI